MDPIETDPPQHSPPGSDPEEEVLEIVREELEGRLHLEEGKGNDGNYDGWSDWGDEEDKVAKEAVLGVEIEDVEEEAVLGVEIEDVEEVEEEKGVGAGYFDSGRRSNGGGSGGDGKYPVRPGAEDCSFYIKTGTCKFGSSCKFNHPVQTTSQPAKERSRDREDTREQQGQLECKYYLRTGGCKYGDACRYSHSKVKTPFSHAQAPVYPVPELNFLNLPIRPGEKECPYYMRNGSCKFGANCRFNHPNPSAGGVSKSQSAFNNSGSPSVYASSKPTISSWSSPRMLNDASSFVPMIFPPPQAIPKNLEWNEYPVPAYSQERGALPTFAVNNLPTESNAYGHHQQSKQVDEFPERPGQPECSYFLKTGDCKFKSNCRYHHPKNQAPKAPPCALSDKGLPLRPDQNICAYYSRYGICKFGPACKFNHPIQAASVGSTEDHPSHFFNSLVDGGTRIIESGNDCDSAGRAEVVTSETF